MKPRASPQVFFNFYSASATGQQIRLNPEKVQAKAILVPKIAKDKKKKKDDEAPVMEDYEFEILYDSQKRQWTTELVKGKYLINVKAPGHPETCQMIKVKKGKKEFDIVCNQLPGAAVKLKIKTVNAAKGKTVKNVFVQLHKNNQQQVEEGVTDKKGEVTFIIKEICSLIITTKKGKYSNLARRIEVTKGLIDSAFEKEIVL